jgi:hypothetical protein
MKAGNSLGNFYCLYNSLIGSVLQYASCVWQIGNKDNLDKLNTVQREGLSIILGLPLTIPNFSNILVVICLLVSHGIEILLCF